MSGNPDAVSCLTVKKRPEFYWLCTKYRLIFIIFPIIFAMFPIWGDNLFCAFLQGLTPPLHPAPGTTRSDVTLTRECQRLGASGCFSAKCSFRPPAFLRNDETNLSPDFAIIGVLPFIAIAIHYTPNPLIFYSQKNKEGG